MTTYYRVRHPAAPDLFVWMVGTYDPETTSFSTPLRRTKTNLGEFATLTITFSQTHPGMYKKQAEYIAKLCGGTVEVCNETPTKKLRHSNTRYVHYTNDVVKSDYKRWIKYCCKRVCMSQSGVSNKWSIVTCPRCLRKKNTHPLVPTSKDDAA